MKSYCWVYGDDIAPSVARLCRPTRLRTMSFRPEMDGSGGPGRQVAAKIWQGAINGLTVLLRAKEKYGVINAVTCVGLGVACQGSTVLSPVCYLAIG